MYIDRKSILDWVEAGQDHALGDFTEGRKKFVWTVIMRNLSQKLVELNFFGTDDLETILAELRVVGERGLSRENDSLIPVSELRDATSDKRVYNNLFGTLHRFHLTRSYGSDPLGPPWPLPNHVLSDDSRTVSENALIYLLLTDSLRYTQDDEVRTEYEDLVLTALYNQTGEVSEYTKQ